MSFQKKTNKLYGNLKSGLFVCIILAFHSFASAEVTLETLPCKKGDHSPLLQKELNLTDKQKEQVKQLHEKYASVVEEKSKTMKTLNEELIAKLQTPGKDAATNTALLEKFKKYQAARNELYTTRFEMALKTRDLLTDEQIKKYKAFYNIKGKEK